MSVVGLHHVQIACPAGSEDLLRGFYGEVLGMPEIPKPPVLAARGGVWFEAGDRQLHCGVEADFHPALKAHPCFLVDDLAAVATAVEVADGDVRWDESIPGVLDCWVDVGSSVQPLGYTSTAQREGGGISPRRAAAGVPRGRRDRSRRG